jgi:membrane protease YdiL (CAAX protease family)
MNEGNTKVSIWNPGAVANWSILFSPIFGAWLMSSNWKEIGNEAKAKSSMLWAYAGIALIVVTLLLNFFVLAEGKSSNGLFLIYFLAWRFTSARSQLKYVKEMYPNGYDKQSWMKPIGTTLGVIILYIGLIMGLAMATASGAQSQIAIEDAQCYDAAGNWICE